MLSERDKRVSLAREQIFRWGDMWKTLEELRTSLYHLIDLMQLGMEQTWAQILDLTDRPTCPPSK